MRHHLVLAAAVLLGVPLFLSAAPKPPIPPGPVTVAVEGTDGDKVFQQYLDDQGNGQKSRLFVAGKTKTIRGLIIDLGDPHGSDRADFEAFCKANDWAAMGTLLRWPKEKGVLRGNLQAIIKDFAKASAHAELENVPWVMYGFSRSTGPNHMLVVENPEKILANLAGGVSARVNPEDIASDLRVPTMCCIGSEDPFASGPPGVYPKLDWFFEKSHYPNYREKNLPWGAAITWGAGHQPSTGFVMQAAFLKDVLAQRMPKDWDPTKGAPKMTDSIKAEDGYLGDPATWETSYPTVTKVGEYKGKDANLAQWLPGPYSAAVWRAYVVKAPTSTVTVTNGVLSCEGGGGGASGGVKISFFDGDQELPTWKVGDGLKIVYAVVESGGTKSITRPVLVYNGQIVPTGDDSTKSSKGPLALLELSATQKAAARACLERTAYAGPADWKLAFSDDFSGTTTPWQAGKLPGTAKVQDGALLIDAETPLNGKPVGQFIAALPYDFPTNVAVAYRFKSFGEKPNDVACMINGMEGGDRPWREGALMFHVGAAEGQKTAWQVHGETDAGLDVKAKPGEWHTVRVERLGDELHATLDGEALPTRKLSAGEARDVKGHRLGFYTVANKAMIGDVKVYVRAPKDPAAVTPAAPTPEAAQDLATALLTLMDAPFAEQRNLAAELIGKVLPELLPTLRKLDTTKLSPPAQAHLEQILKAVPPAK